MRSSHLENSVFGAAPPKAPAKSDITTLAARAIIKDETDQRNAKTERLRAARLKSESAMAREPAVTARKQPRRKNMACKVDG